MIKRHLEKWEYDVHVAKISVRVMTEFAAFDPQLVLDGYAGFLFITDITGVLRYAKCQMCR